MAQMTIRLDDELAEHCRQAADDEGKSVNGWVVMVLRTMTDPEASGSDVERMRERLRRAGILAEPPRSTKKRPPDDVLARARAAAGRGMPLSDLVSQDREDRDRAVAGLPERPES